MQQSNLEMALGLAQELERIAYYELLGLAPGADYVRIREAYHARAQMMHPDRFLGQDPAVRRIIYDLYKRIAEAYQVLSDPQLRYEYDRALEKGQLRLQATSRARRLTADEREIGNVIARVYYRSARLKQLRGDYAAAWIDVRLGLSLEPAPPLRALERLLQARMRRQTRNPSGRSEASKG